MIARRHRAVKMTAEQRAIAQLSQMTRRELRNELMKCGYSEPTASAATDVFYQVIETVRTGRPAQPLSGS